MKSTRISSKKRACLFIPLGIIIFISIIITALALSNLNLPQHSATLDHLSELEKARLSEAVQLRTALGDYAWPGWSRADIPVILYNEQYAFLVGDPNPPAGWVKIPSMQPRGGSWELVPGDLINGQPYFRTLINSPDETPQAFTVLVGDRWVAAFQTREYAQIGFYRDFRQEFPPFISNLVPVRLLWALLMGKTETYIGSLEHESFHAFQGIQARDQLIESESVYSVMENYPFDAQKKAWFAETKLLVQAAQAVTDQEALDLARQFLQMRTARRTDLSAAEVQLEQLREWEEGLAKYAELEITRLAGSDNGYTPIQGLTLDKDFHQYTNQQQWWTEQLNEAKNQNLSGETRFYYSGNALAVVLDRLLPDWKSRALPGGEFLDDLLEQAVR
ncbi:MAG TPA: hypothetical protein VLD65_04995 [Anaerolineales bacterium]|nr:hypothetical protein [Anaerolineales bacterium]